ncbi:MAG: bifunctional diaminohydroxyphosphoribosylaminopyrimidine deaminase/5-amino-6-(5-phosphoribosylamino)uracil reductase RibD [Clostridium sp.]|uniref:bifunctional diaminohydroxyphosphoribosylaminopyrimidine deaminase/5-amino-6-(5-phosphoribosylamino)uracil reductase RibD n=1 Tax=Clostridium sp. TaxID=1506 RepID=UPI003F322982
MKEDIFYMKKAIELAKKGEGYVNPNPMVGCVIVKKDKIIGEGYHERFGGHHAEVNAIKSATESIEGGTIYITLEPCTHYGKTPPCILKVIKEKPKKVVIGVLDPNPLVCGKGMEMLIEEGIEVKVGILEEECRELNEVFFHYITKKKPLCILKGAMSLDGKIATKYGESKWISNEKSRKITAEYRHKYSGIMVGINTVLKDNPMLTCRIENGISPVRVILDSKLRIPLDSNIVKDKENKTIVFTTVKDDKKIEQLNREGVQVIITPIKNSKVQLPFVIEKLYELNIDSLLIEGGGTLNDSLFKEGIVDKLKLFIAPKIIGGRDSKNFIAGDGVEFLSEATNIFVKKITNIEGDILIEGDVIKEERVCLQE